MRIEDFVGLEIVSADAMVIGHVEGVGIDINTWTVPALKVGLKRGVEEELGIDKPRFGSTVILVKTEAVDSISDTITLKQELKSIPEIMVEGERELMTAGSVIDTRVIAKGGRQLGYVDNFIFSPEKDWAVSYMVIKLEKSVLGDLGMKKPRLGTPSIKVLSQDIRTIGDMVLLSIDIKELKDYLEKKPRKGKEPAPASEEIIEMPNRLPFEFSDDMDNDEE